MTDDNLTVTVHGATADLAETLRHQGCRVDHDTTGAPVDIAIIVTEHLPNDDELWPAAAMTATADTITLTARLADRLAAGALVLIVVAEPPERARDHRPGDAVLSASLATAMRLFASDWARTTGARCVLAISADPDPDAIASLASWLAAPQAPPLTGHVIDLDAGQHVALRPTCR